MSNERIESETLAALLDGTLTDEERSQVLERLARADESYAELLEASALLRELREENTAFRAGLPPPQRRPATTRRAGRWRRVLWVAVPAIAAAAVVAVVLPRLAGSSAERLVLAVGDAVPAEDGRDMAARFGSDWEQPVWSTVRGADDALAPEVRAFRAGARFAQLEVALRARDSSAAANAAATLALLASGMDGGAPIAAQVERIAMPGDGSPDAALTAVVSSLRDLTGSPSWFDLGTWSEAARLALRAGHTEFFAGGGRPMEELSRILAGLPSGAGHPRAAAAGRFRAIAARTPTSVAEFDSMRAELDSAIAAVGR